ncbi:MAG: hypothetical protein HY898_03065 [Deltaproteobacteria bacterium]|nr:hypothetical protein [Deltaproteobacteria bacterium]
MRAFLLVPLAALALAGCSWFDDGESAGSSSAQAQGGGACDDGNDCTRDIQTGHGCQHHDLPSGRACSATRGQCSGTGTCNGHGTCNVAAWCDDDNGCTNDSCQNRPMQGFVCVHTNRPTGAHCNDQSACTSTDRCTSEGLCAGNPVSCDDDDPCTTDSCEPSSGCHHANAPSSTACDDDNPCTTNDHCNGHGRCISGGPTDCDDGNDCTVDNCVRRLGCTHRPRNNHAACDDQNACTQGDRCDGAGQCAAGHPIICDDGNPCTVDSCDPATGCVFSPAPTTVSCTDGNGCTTGDHCDGQGACASGAPVVCDDSNSCTADLCETETGACLYLNEDVTVSCNDNVLCTAGDHCDGLGTCIGTVDISIACDDNNACTGPDQCTQQATCAGVLIDPSDGNPCTTDTCNPLTGVSHAPVAAGVPCSDGNPANGLELCDGSGTCAPGTSSIPVLERVGGQDPNVKERILGAGRHPVAVGPLGIAVAFVEPLMFDNSPPRLGVATFTLAAGGKGVARISDVTLNADPVVAPLPDGSFALAYTTYGLDGDGLGIGLVRISKTGAIASTTQIVNQTVEYGQRAPDILWIESKVVVAWEDESPSDGRRICQRAFSDQLAPLGDQECEPVEEAWASRVSLAAAGTELAMVWRKDGPIGTDLVVKLGSVKTTVPLVDLPPAEAAAVIALDTDGLLLVYTDGAGVQKAAVIDSAMPVSSPVTLNLFAEERYTPALTATADGIYLAWRQAAQLPWNANLDELYLQKVNADGAPAGTLYTLPADTPHLLGDQSTPALAAVPLLPSGAIFSAWEDLAPNVQGQSPHGDVLISLMATPIVH